MGAVRKITALYFDQGAFVGQREVSFFDPDAKEQQSIPLPNLAYYCGHCGEIWGRVVYEPSPPSGKTFWALEQRYCPEHGDGYFLVGADARQLSLCSTPLLAREALLLCLNHKERP